MGEKSKPITVICPICDKTVESATIEEALTEADAKGIHYDGGFDLVCDDCYKNTPYGKEDL